PGRRAPVPHQGLVPGALAAVVGLARGIAAPGREAARDERRRSRSREGEPSQLKRSACASHGFLVTLIGDVARTALREFAARCARRRRTLAAPERSGGGQVVVP